jgi:hypothetical protein
MSIKRRDMQDLRKLRNFRQVRTDWKNSMIEGNCSIGNQISRNALRKKKLSVESFQNNI